MDDSNTEHLDLRDLDLDTVIKVVELSDPPPPDPPPDDTGTPPERPEDDADVDLGSSDLDLGRFNLQTEIAQRLYKRTKEATASDLARLLVWFFGITLILLCLLGFYLNWGCCGDTTANTSERYSDFLSTVLGGMSSLFGPLLAFVLGYYFGIGKQTDGPKN